MLVSLHIEHIAVIEKAGIVFDSGLNVLTGETGAGKSIVIDSLNAVLGERISRDLVRTGSQQATVSAVFSQISDSSRRILEELGLEPEEDGTLLIQRQISVDGKGSCRVNGRPVTVGMLRSLGRSLVNIHGQHENQALLSAEKHIDYLDRLGGLSEIRHTYEEAYHRYCSIRRQLKAVDMDEELKARRIDLLRYQIDEIVSARLRPGEEETLLAQRAVYRHAEKIAAALQEARLSLTGDEERDGGLSAVTAASAALTEAGQYMEEAQSLSKRLESALYELQECAEELREFTDRLDFDQEDLEQTENRLEHIRRITAKYGGSEEEALAYLSHAQEELESIELSDEQAARLKKQLEQAKEETIEASRGLTAARKQAAEQFTERVQAQLAFLDMPGVRLAVQLDPVPLTVTGGDRVEFLIAANPGEEPRSIARIASGGELSRIMLAMKSVLADVDDIDTLVFDEVDTGISGRAAWKVGVKLRETAASRQILCVTHLAQIAAQAHHHIFISKAVRDGRTYTEVASLDEAGRENELARIIGGEVTQASRRAAKEMMDKA